MNAPPRLTSGGTAIALACTGAGWQWGRTFRVGGALLPFCAGFQRPIIWVLLRSPLLPHLLPVLGPYTCPYETTTTMTTRRRRTMRLIEANWQLSSHFEPARIGPLPATPGRWVNFGSMVSDRAAHDVPVVCRSDVHRNKETHEQVRRRLSYRLTGPII